MKKARYTDTMQYLAKKYNFAPPQELPRYNRKSLEAMYETIHADNFNLLRTVRDNIDFCPECNGLGIVNRNGHLINCPQNCIASQQNKYDYLMRMDQNMQTNTNPLDNQQPMSFARYQKGANNRDRSIALGIAIELVKSYPHGVEIDGVYKNSLMLFGETGTGKTALSSAIINEFLKRGHIAFFRRVDDIMAAIRSTYARNDVESKFTTDEMERFFAKADILAMDEFDMSKISEHDQQKIERIINHRCDNLLPTIMTTNLTQDEFKHRWGYRTHSRVVHMAHWVSINGVIRNQNRPIGA